LSANSSRLLNTLLDTTPSRHLIDQLASQHKLDVSEIRPAGLQSNGVAAQPAGTGDVRTSGRLWDGFPAALVVVGVLVFLLALGGIVYICATWDRYYIYITLFRIYLFYRFTFKYFRGYYVHEKYSTLLHSTNNDT